MVIAIVTFPAPSEPLSDPRALLEATAPAYQRIVGLKRKYFIGNERNAGGVYEWQDENAAAAFYNEEWRTRMAEQYGVTPTVELFDAPCVVDNVARDIVYADHA